MTAHGAPPCPLCAASAPRRYHRDRSRAYWHCARCALVFVPPDAWVDRTAERARYDQHRNTPDDPRYRRFLARLADPMVERLPPGAVGLDFGSGPGPTLDGMLADAGLRVHRYDPFYAPNPAVWSRRYDFITASEVLEHLRDPRMELDRLFSALAPGGWLGVMTRWVGARERFLRSRYIRDPTHVCFYSPETCRWIARRWRAALELPAPDVALFRTTPAPSDRGAPRFCVSQDDGVS